MFFFAMVLLNVVVINCSRKRIILREGKNPPKVSELDVPVGVEQNVLRLEVTVHHVAAVDELQCEADLRCHQPRLAQLHGKLGKQLAAGHVLH